jgi:DNA (cytosine-5)-methyltransferase 1
VTSEDERILKSDRSRKTLNVVSLFTGVGGLDYGLEAANFETRVAVELDPIACRTLQLNRQFPVIERDIHKVTSKEILDAGTLKVGQLDLLVGGPPCQPFSKAGYWASGDARRLDDPRADTLAAFLRVIRDTRPRVFLLENVPGLAFSGKDDGLVHILNGVKEINRLAQTKYRVHWQVLNAADYGVPQKRERLFLVGSRDGKLFSFPKPTHFPNSGLSTGQVRYRTAWDAIGELPIGRDEQTLALRGKWADLLPTIPEGQNYLWHTERGGGEPIFGWRTRYWSFLLKLAKDRPAWTIQAQPGPAIGPFHWMNRRLSVRELCGLQTFPDGIKFDCSQNETQRLLGNAVPSLLAEVLGREIRTQLFGGKIDRSALKLLPPDRGPPPRQELVTQMPRKYLRLIGNHVEHPGTGLGRGALKRDAANRQT